MLSLISNFKLPNTGIIRCQFPSEICRLGYSRVEAILFTKILVSNLVITCAPPKMNYL